MIGIYKITSPTKKVYVGQSIDIEKRWKEHKKVGDKKNGKIYKSLNKYGIGNHIFEVIEECEREKLNEREIYWGLFYKVLDNGLNCKLGEQNCIFSDSTKKLMSEKKKNTKQSEFTKNLRKENTKKTWVEKRNNGFKKSEETRLKMSLSKKGTPKPPGFGEHNKYPKSEETRKKMSEVRIGIPIHTTESKLKLYNIGKLRNMESCYTAGNISRCTPIIQYNLNGEFIKEWNSASEAEYFITNNKNKDNIRACIRGEQKTAYGFKWINKNGIN